MCEFINSESLQSESAFTYGLANFVSVSFVVEWALSVKRMCLYIVCVHVCVHTQARMRERERENPTWINKISFHFFTHRNVGQPALSQNIFIWYPM